jgi:hypothetical protein
MAGVVFGVRKTKAPYQVGHIYWTSCKIPKTRTISVSLLVIRRHYDTTMYMSPYVCTMYTIHLRSKKAFYLRSLACAHIFTVLYCTFFVSHQYFHAHSIHSQLVFSNSTMAVQKRQPGGSRWNLTHILAALAVTITFTTLLKLSTVSTCDQDIYTAKLDNKLNGPKRGRKTPTLSSRQSYGFLDDISDDSWKLLQEHARASSSYLNPENPEEGVLYPDMYWYMNNVQVRERQRLCKRILS